VVLILFFIWILPLGAFIDPSKEQKVCGGQRAICLCSHHFANNKEKGDGKTMMISNPGVNKEATSAGGASHNFLSSHFYYQPNLFVSSFSNQEQSFLNLLFSREVEHVPKV
jgi:hypothetical protein